MTTPLGFALSVFGTTSSGKSTLLNALLGAQLLPVDAGEVSAGLVKISAHSAPVALHISGNEDARWNEASYQNASPETVHAHLRGLLALYQHHRQDEQITQLPSVELGVSLNHAYQLLDWPAQLPLIVLDLPGLRTANDEILKESLKLVDPEQYAILPMLVVDVTKIFEHEAISKALKLAKESTELSPIIILNKVDRLTSADSEVSKYIAHAAKLINSAGHQLDEERICPMSSLLLAEASGVLIALERYIYARAQHEDKLRMRLSSLVQELGVHLQKGLINAYTSDDKIITLIEDHVSALRRGKLQLNMDHVVLLAEQAIKSSGLAQVSQNIRRSVKMKLGHQTSHGFLMKKYRAIHSIFNVMIWSDGVLDPHELYLANGMLSEYAAQFLGPTFSFQQEEELKQLSDEPLNLELEQLHKIEQLIPDDELRWLAKSLATIAFTDGSMHTNEAKLIELIEQKISR